MSRQQLKHWAAPLWARLSQALCGPAFAQCIQAHLPAHQQPPHGGVQA
jgi:hypothetical protein